MKKILMIFFILIGLYLLFTNVNKIPWIAFGKSGDSVKVTEKIDMIDINISSVRTTVIPENRNDVTAKLEGKGDVTISKNGDTIEVKYERGFFNGFPFFKKSSLTVFVPKDYEKDMKLRVGSGHLEFSGKPMNLQELLVEVHSGNVSLENLTVQEFTQDVASGNAKIESLSANSAVFEIRSGNVTLEDYSGKLEADISSGRLKAQFSELTDSVDIDVNSGLLDLDLPNDADFTLNGKSNSGFISNKFSLKGKNGESSKLQGIHGSGKYEINLEVNSGKADIH